MRARDVAPVMSIQALDLEPREASTARLRMTPARGPARRPRGVGRAGKMAVSLAVCVAAAQVMGCASTRGSERAASDPQAVAVAPPAQPERAGPSIFRYSWVWTDEVGTSARLARWAGTPLVVAGIYTTCKTTCPRTVAKLEKVDAAYRRARQPAQFLLVTLDPENDKPADLLRYKRDSHLPDAWHLLAGSVRDTRELTEVLDLHVIDDGPHVMHEGKIVVFNAEGRSVRRYGGWALDEETADR